MSRNACNGENGETGEKLPAAGDLNWMPKVAPWRLAILAKMAILVKLAILAKSPCMQWRNWRKITSLWRFELDAKSGPLEAGDFGEIGDFGKNRQRAGNSSDKCPRPLETGNFGENGDCSKIGNFGKNRQRAGDMWQNIQIGCQKWPLQSG